MRIAYLLLPFVISFSATASAFCTKSGEQTSGMNKICYYTCVSGTKAITIGATELCPLSINGYAPQAFYSSAAWSAQYSVNNLEAANYQAMPSYGEAKHVVLPTRSMDE